MKKIILFILLAILFFCGLSVLIFNSGNSNDISKQDSDNSNYKINSKDIDISKDITEEPVIKVYITKTKKIKKIKLEEYIEGVTASEMQPEFQLEALKAQAVAARTFAISHMSDYGGIQYSGAHGADVNDTSSCQVYVDKDDKVKSWPKKYANDYWNKIVQAVTSTKGEVITYNGKIIMYPYYFSTSSGKTENSVDVFNLDEPYLKSVDSSIENVSPNFRTMAKYTYKFFINKINTSVKGADLAYDNLKNQVSVIRRTNAGSVIKIGLGKETITGSKFREILNLKSANFTIGYDNGYVEIVCSGYGHDVGMSQWGANIMASMNKGYKEIIRHYYTGVNIEKLAYGK